MDPVQPPDETPLPIDPATAALYDRYPSAKTALDALDAAHAGIEDAVIPMYHAASDALDGAARGIATATAGVMGGVDAALDAANGKIAKAVQRIDGTANKVLDQAVDKLADAGVAMPYTHGERMAQLNDPTGDAIPAVVMPAVFDALGIPPPSSARIQAAPLPCETQAGCESVAGRRWWNGTCYLQHYPGGSIPGLPGTWVALNNDCSVATTNTVEPPTQGVTVIGNCGTEADCNSVPGRMWWNGRCWRQQGNGIPLPGQTGNWVVLNNTCLDGDQVLAAMNLTSPPVSPYVPPQSSPYVPPVSPPVSPPIINVSPVPVVTPPPPISVTPPPPVITISPPPPGTPCPPTTIQVQCVTGPTSPITTVPPIPPVITGPPPPPPPPPPPTMPPPPPPDSPPPPPPGPTLQAGTVAQWGYLNTCASAEANCQQVSALPGGTLGGTIQANVGTGPFGQFVAAVGATIDGITSTVTDVKVDWDTAKKLIQGSIDIVFPSYLPNNTAAATISAEIAKLNWIGRITGAPMDYLSTWAQYQLQYCNPLYIPSQSELNQMIYRQEMSYDEWACHTKALGNIETLANRSLYAGSVIPNVSDVVTLYMRGVIPTEQAFRDRMRQSGILREEHTAEFLALAQQIPTSGDLVRFMVRDSGDETVVQKYGYDFEFKDKYTPEIQRWAKMNGIDDRYFQYLWRAHWQIPSNTQLYDMLHRLRPDTAAYQQWYSNWVDPQSGQPRQGAPLSPPLVTTEDVRQALQVNDMAPGWIEGLIATSYRPITNSDLRRGYMFGMYKKDRLVSGMKDNGYTGESALELADFFEAEKLKTLSNQTGVMTLRKAIKYYKSGAISRNELNNVMIDLIPDTDTRDGQLFRIDLEMKADQRIECIAAERKRYLYGEHNDLQSMAALAQMGMDPQSVTRIVQEWKCLKESRLKEPRVAMLCTWYTNGYLSNDEYIRRLMNLGYTEVDAYEIAASCWRSEMLKRWQKQNAEQRALIKEWEKEMKQGKQDYTQAIKDAKDQIKQNEASMKQYQKELAKQPAYSGASSPAPPTRPQR